ncbi:TPA: hypothetical protein U2K36_003204, partial [Legionella pneumophila]|nr:hypothetical protein [Legionella pneumophila]
MTNLENAIVFESKRSRKNIENIKNEIFFSIFKSKKGYLTLKVQIGFDIARKVKITEESKIKLGCDREDKTIWYLIIGEEGFSISKSKNESSYNSAIRWPFQFLD